MEVIFQAEACWIGLIAKYRMLGGDAGWARGGDFGGADIAASGVVGGGVGEQRHGLAAIVGYFVLDAVPATSGGGEAGGFFAARGCCEVIDDGAAIDPQTLR